MTYKNCPMGCIRNDDNKLPKIFELCTRPTLIAKYLTSLLSI